MSGLDSGARALKPLPRADAACADGSPGQRGDQPDPAEAWQPIEYPDAIDDQETPTGGSRRVEVAEIGFTGVTSTKSQQVPGRLVLRRIPDRNPGGDGQATLFHSWRFHALATDPEVLDTVAADQTRRQHAILAAVHADLKASALAHLPSTSFAANSAWLVLAVIAFNLTRAAAWPAPHLANATTATIRGNQVHVTARSRPRPDASCCTCPPTGPGSRRGPECSPT